MTKRYILHCQPGRDAMAEYVLQRYGYDVFRPVIPHLIRNWPANLEPRFKSLFPRYLFVKDPGAMGWKLLHFLPSLMSHNPFMIIDNRLASIDEKSFDFRMIVRTQELQFSNSAKKPRAPFKVGDRIQVKDGPWVEFQGTIQTIDKRGRIRFLTEMLGRHVQTTWTPTTAGSSGLGAEEVLDLAP